MAIVYLHKRKLDGVVFYVGVGNKEKRAYDKNRRGKFWKDYTSKHDYIVEIIHRDITLSEAFEIEKSLIAKYGRRDLGRGPLVNQTDGGYSGSLNFSTETIEKMRHCKLGKKLTEEHKKKISESGKGRVYSEETKKLLSEGKVGSKNPMYNKAPWNKGKPQTEEVKLKLRLANIGKKRSKQTNNE